MNQTPIDLTPLTNLIPSPTTIIMAVLGFAASLIAIAAVMRAVDQVFFLIRGKTRRQVREEHANEQKRIAKEKSFQARYERSQMESEYKTWKQSRGYF